MRSHLRTTAQNPASKPRMPLRDPDPQDIRRHGRGGLLGHQAAQRQRRVHGKGQHQHRQLNEVLGPVHPSPRGPPSGLNPGRARFSSPVAGFGFWVGSLGSVFGLGCWVGSLGSVFGLSRWAKSLGSVFGLGCLAQSVFTPQSLYTLNHSRTSEFTVHTRTMNVPTHSR